MKKLIAILVFCLIASPIFAEEIHGWVKSDTCFVVKAPSADEVPVGFILRGAAVTVKDAGDRWFKIVYAPVRDIHTKSYIDCNGCYILKEGFTTKIQDR